MNPGMLSDSEVRTSDVVPVWYTDFDVHLPPADPRLANDTERKVWQLLCELLCERDLAITGRLVTDRLKDHKIARQTNRQRQRTVQPPLHPAT